MPGFSVVLPVRNGGEYVKECVKSILAQSHADYNLIVLDNASDDGTYEWITGLQEKKIQVHRSPMSLTIEQNWARIRDIPKNEYMTMIGHDDVLHAHYLEEMDKLITLYPEASLYQTHFEFIDENGNHVRDCLPMEKIQHADEFLSCQMRRSMESTGTGYMMRSADFDRLGGMPVEYPNLIYSDYELWLKLMRLAYKATSPRKCFSYRLHLSVSRTTNGMLYQEAFSRYVNFIKSLASGDDKINKVVHRDGREFLLYNCESLSHRLLKTPRRNRTISVKDFVRKCERFASELIPGQPFEPMKRWRIKAAVLLDQHRLGRFAFHLFKKLFR